MIWPRVTFMPNIIISWIRYLFYIKGMNKIELSPKNLVVDKIKSSQIAIHGYDSDNIPRSIIPSEIIWKSSDTQELRFSFNITVKELKGRPIQVQYF